MVEVDTPLVAEALLLSACRGTAPTQLALHVAVHSLVATIVLRTARPTPHELDAEITSAEMGPANPRVVEEPATLVPETPATRPAPAPPPG